MGLGGANPILEVLVNKYEEGRREKLAWARTVKVGDTICTCSYEHLKVTSIYSKEYVPRLWVSRVYNVLFDLIDLLPEKMKKKAEDALCDLDHVIRRNEIPGVSELSEIGVNLENGNVCWLMSCADPVPHEWQHD